MDHSINHNHIGGTGFLRHQTFSNTNHNNSNHESSNRLLPPFARNEFTPFEYGHLDPYNDGLFYDAQGHPSPLAPVTSNNQPLKVQQPFFLGVSPEANPTNILANSAQGYEHSLFGGDFLHHSAPNDIVAVSSEWNPMAVVESTVNSILPIRATSPMPQVSDVYNTKMSY